MRRPLDCPTEVGAEVVLSRRDVRAGNEPAAFALRPVGLNAERVDDEHERAIALGERVEVDLDVVVGADVIAVGERRADRRVRLEGANAEVDRVGRIPDEDFGGVGRRLMVDGLIDREAGEQRRAAPDGFVEDAVDLRVGGDSRDGHRQIAGASVVDLLRRGRRGSGELKNCEEGKHGIKYRVMTCRADVPASSCFYGFASSVAQGASSGMRRSSSRCAATVSATARNSGGATLKRVPLSCFASASQL